MGKGCRNAWIAMACAVLVAAPEASAGERLSDGERMIGAVNALRASHGLAPVGFSRSLARSSRRYAAWQMSADWFGHADRIRAVGRWSSLGETIAIHRGHRPRVHVTVRKWARSPGHAALLLSPTFSQAGAGLSRGRFGRRRATIWVLQLGSPSPLRASGAAPAPPA
jgi:uncharacterized protein YkwD